MYMKYMKENMRLCIDISYMYQAINLKVVELIVRLPQVKGQFKDINVICVSSVFNF